MLENRLILFDGTSTFCQNIFLVVSVGKWSAASEVYVEDVLYHLESIVEGWVNMSY